MISRGKSLPLSLPSCDSLTSVMAGPLAHSQPLSHDSRAEKAAAWAAQATVLLVEDSQVNREVTIVKLEALGCQLDTAENGRDALAAIERQRDDLILMDYRMPLMDGLTVTRTIRARERDGSERVPIVALTAHAAEADLQPCVAAGRDDYLTKPFTQEQRLAILRRWLPAFGVPQTSAALPTGPVASDEHARPDRTAPDVVCLLPETESCLDLKTLLALRALQRPGGPNVVARILGNDPRTSADYMHTVHETIRQQDAQTLFQTMHTVDSIGAPVGAPTLSSLFTQLEALKRSGDLGPAQDHPARMEPAYAASCQALQEELEERAA